MTEVAILIPVLNRPHRVIPLLQSIAASARFVQLDPFFLVSPGDTAELDAIHGYTTEDADIDASVDVMEWEAGQGDYARKMNYGIEHTDSEFVFFGADDLIFHPGWIERALACHLETHACVIGTNDLGNHQVIRGDHSTHTLVCREYLECGAIDGPALLHEGYWHNWVDAEFVETAIARETFAAATDSIVEHLHPLWKKGDGDSTYRKGQEHFGLDAELFRSRKPLWAGNHASERPE